MARFGLSTLPIYFNIGKSKVFLGSLINPKNKIAPKIISKNLRQNTRLAKNFLS